MALRHVHRRVRLNRVCFHFLRIILLIVIGDDIDIIGELGAVHILIRLLILLRLIPIPKLIVAIEHLHGVLVVDLGASAGATLTIPNSLALADWELG